VIHNFTPAVRHHYRVGVPYAGEYTILINSDDEAFGGTGNFTQERLTSSPSEWNGRPNHIELTLPPLASLIFRYEGKSTKADKTKKSTKQATPKKAATTKKRATAKK
jgi:1,4-alpha-glucan branching enzyme